MASMMHKYGHQLLYTVRNLALRLEGANDIHDYKMVIKCRTQLTQFQHKTSIPQVAAKIRNNIWMLAFFHHLNFLLNNSKVITCTNRRLKLKH